jgi:thymidylate synthase
MLVIKGNNVNDAYHEALWVMKSNGVSRDSRNGKVMTVNEPVATVYAKPKRRMLFDAKRNANPYFHVMESIWMLAGRRDLGFITKYAANMSDYSDDGTTLGGSYGYRWRHHFGTDQLKNLINLLKKDPNSRRAVLAMWDPLEDSERVMTSKDVPCNTTVYFKVVGKYLHMTVCNRSNDIIWGCYGANAVHMSYMMEFVASSLKLQVGTYTQISNDWHIYEPHFPLLDDIEDVSDSIYTNEWRHTSLWLDDVESPDVFLRECNEFCENILEGDFYGSYTSSYMNWVLQPMARSWKAYKEGDLTRALQYAMCIRDTAILTACTMWLARKSK